MSKRFRMFLVMMLIPVIVMVFEYIILWYPYEYLGNPSNLTYNNILDITFTSAIVLFTMIQIILTFFQLDSQSKQYMPFIFAHSPEPGTITIENAGGGPAWNVDVVIKTKNQNLNSIQKHFEAIYAKATTKIDLFKILDVKYVMNPVEVNISYFCDKEKEEKEIWEGTIEVKNRYDL